ncbi:MAG: AMP-binding protein [Deltaproteobacteria bacterium]|nr:AMP-binding protein [Deltaproteobacteria bacterium]
MFHANAWGLPYGPSCREQAGLSRSAPGHGEPPRGDGRRAGHLSAAVPTLWLGVLSAFDREPGRWDVSAMRSIVTGGSAAPLPMIERFDRAYGIQIVHEWGMTETNPIGTVSRVKRTLAPPPRRPGARRGQPGLPGALRRAPPRPGPGGAILPGTGPPWASWRCAAHSSRRPTQAAKAQTASRATAGSGPATS